MSKYTPTTEEVLSALAFCRAYGQGGIPQVPENETPEEAGERWLKQVKAEAWREGYHSISGLKFAVNQYLDNGGFAGFEVDNALDEAEKAKNPYREDSPE